MTIKERNKADQIFIISEAKKIKKEKQAKKEKKKGDKQWQKSQT